MSSSFHYVEYRLLPGPREAGRLDTQGLRDAFLVSNLFKPGELRLILTDMDRLALGAAMPETAITLPPCAELRGDYFTERREIGIVNLGAAGHVHVGGTTYSLEPCDFLYIGAGNPDIRFERCGDAAPRFYFLSCPAHTAYPTRQIRRADVPPELIGDPARAAQRRLTKFIYPDGAASCQLVMGMTEIEPGSAWNTMPCHTHLRRSEIYLYQGLEDGIVVHLMGEPQETRHLIVRNFDAILSPPWSIHSGAGTRPYSFIWGMAGENQAFQDMDPIEPSQLR